MKPKRIFLGLSLLLGVALTSCVGLFSTSTPAPILVEISSSGGTCTVKDISGSYPGSKPNNPWVHVSLFSHSAPVTFHSDDDVYQVSFSGSSPLAKFNSQFEVAHAKDLTSKVTFTAWKCGLGQPNQPSTNPNPPCSYTFKVTDITNPKVCDPTIHVTK